MPDPIKWYFDTEHDAKVEALREVAEQLKTLNETMKTILKRIEEVKK